MPASPAEPEHIDNHHVAVLKGRMVLETFLTGLQAICGSMMELSCSPTPRRTGSFVRLQYFLVFFTYTSDEIKKINDDSEI